jgi:hypothetical protein
MKPTSLNERVQSLLFRAGVHGAAVACSPESRATLREAHKHPVLWLEARTELIAMGIAPSMIDELVKHPGEPPPANSPDDYGISKVVTMTTRANGDGTNGHVNDAKPRREGAQQRQQQQEAPSIDLDAVFAFLGDERASAPRELIKRQLPAFGVAVTGGQSSAGKTFIAIYKSVCLST